MELSDFIGKVVIGAKTKKRYILSQITAPYIAASAVVKDAQGNCASYRWDTINGDPISNGVLVFEDVSLTESFIAAYNAYSHTESARYAELGYWMRKD